MAVRHGYGKIAGTDALVFAYDTGDTVNSYRGEPTTNIIAGTNAIYTVAGTYITNTTVDGVRILENDQVNNSHVMWNGATGFIVTCSAGAYITVSAEYRTNCTIRIRFRDNPYDDQYDATGVNTATISAQDIDINTNGEWERYSLTAQTSTANPDLWWYLVDYRTNNEFGRVEIRNWQIEVKSHATPYVNGTRSATQGLLDLTGTGTISIDNATYDSSAMMTFDGSNDYISTSNSYNGSNSLSVEAICKFYSVSSPGDQVVYFNANGQGLYPRLFKNTSNKFLIQYRPSGTTTSITGNTTLQANQFYHTVFTYDATAGGILYINGTVDGTNSGVTGNHEKGNNHAIRIGNDTNVNYYMNGEIPVVKKYSRVLTADEVRNNYRHYKTRFNI